MKISSIYYLTIIAILIPSLSFAQQDPEARKILDQVSSKVKSSQSIQANFELVIENKRENNSTKTKGFIKIKGNKYYLESMGTKVYYDGKTLWSFMEDVKEVTISEPDQTNDDFVENPAKIFTFYNRDFKYKLVGEAKTADGWMYEIDLFPITFDQPYSRIKLYIGRESYILYEVKAISKEGIVYSAYIQNTKFNTPMNDDIFLFRPEKHRGIEVVDLR